MTEHQHIWSGIAHLDGCHSYSWHYTCPCGAARHRGGERDFSGDGMSTAMWFEESCARCQELLEGAEPKEWDEVVEPETKS